MSYDAWVEIDTGGAEPARLESDVWLNYTYNVYPMFVKALGKTLGIKALDGEQADFVAITLKNAIERMKSEPEEYKVMNPPNGWGDYEGAIKFLEGIVDLCLLHPRATFRIT